MRHAWKVALLTIALGSFLACGSAAYYSGRRHYDNRDYDQAVKKLEEALRERPKDYKIRALYERAKLSASEEHFHNAQRLLNENRYEEAARELQSALVFNPSNQHAQDTLQKIYATLQEQEAQEKAARISIDQMKKEADKQSGPMMLDASSNIPLVLKFNNTSVKTVFDAVSKASGVNFLYDERADTQKKVTVDFSNVRLQQVLDYLMMQTKHFYQVLDSHTLMIIPDNKQKRDEYEEQVMRTFYLSNADAKDVFQLVRSILQARKMAMNQDLNSITIKDTPDMVALAQKIIEANDKSKGEVAVNVEMIEVNSNKMRTLGIDPSAKSLTVGPNINFRAGAPTSLPSGQWGRQYQGSMSIGPLPNFVVSFILTDTDSQVLARPQLRVMEGKKASVHIGDKQPIPTANLGGYGYNPNPGGSGNQGGGYGYPMVSYTYQDVGVKIEIEPKVHHNKEITLKLKAEVSSVTGEVAGSGGAPAQPIIGTREVVTEIRLEDGETSMLAGLIREEDRTAYSGIPGIGEIPLLRRLFGKTEDKTFATDVIVLLTPHIIRMPNITDEDLRGLWVGTEQQPRLKGLRESSFQPSPFEGDGGAPGVAPVPAKEPREVPREGKDGKPKDASPEEGQTLPPEDLERKEPPPDAPPQPETNPKVEARLLISPTTLQASTGGQVVLNLVVVGARDGKTLRAEIEYPNDVLQFAGGDEGTFFKMGGSVSTFSASESRPGLISVDMGRADGASSGSGLLLRLRFNAVKAGVARVNVGGANLLDTSGQGASLAPVFAMITVQGGEGGAAPAP